MENTVYLGRMEDSIIPHKYAVDGHPGRLRRCIEVGAGRMT